MSRRPYPTIDGIAVPVFMLDLPDRHVKEENNHHNEWYAQTMGKVAVTKLLRNLARHQYVMPIDAHEWIHKNYDPPELPTEEQAAKEVICAYERGEQFKKYDYRSEEYYFEDISPNTVDELIRKYKLHGPLDDPIGRVLEEGKEASGLVPRKKRKYVIQTSEDELFY